MAKKTIDTSNWIASDTPTPTIDTSNWLPVETPIEQDFNIENVQKRFEQDAPREEALRKDLDQYVGLNEQEKKYLIDKSLSGELKGADFSQTLFTMAGLMPEQKKIVTKDAKGNKIYADEKDMFDIFEEQKKDFNYDKLVSDLTTKLQTSSKNSYYMKDKGDGTLIAVPLAINEKPEAKDVKNVQVFSSLDDDAVGDSRLADVAKKAYNIIPSVAQGFISIPETVQGLVTGKTGGTYKLLKTALEESKFKTAQEFQKGVIESENIKEFSDLLSKDAYNLSPDRIINTVVNVASSLAEFGLTRKFVPIKGKGGTFAAGIAMNIKEPLQAAEDAGVEGRGKYAVAATYALAASAIETAIGIEGKLFDDAATSAKKEMINKIIKDNVEVVGGKLTKESIENLYKETLKEIPSFYAKYVKNTVGEVTEEVAQNMIQNATQEIHDIVMKDDPEAAKFNTKFWSPEALGEYINSAVGGFIGGAGGSLFIRNKQSQTAYDAIKDGKENELKVQLVSGLKEGRLTQEDYDRAIFKIDSYKSYYDATKDRNVTDEERRKIFDLTYEKENTKSGVERLKQNNPGGINDGLIATKEQEVRDYTQQINDIWSTAEARTSEAPVEQAKVEVPQWKTDLDTFSKEVGNADKQVSQNFVTKDKIETAVGASPQLNELSKPFSVDFKAPHLPEDAGNIQIRDGILYEPYLVKQEGKEDVVQTRQLPVYAMEDNNGGTWLFAVGQKTDLDAPDVSYLIKLNEEGNYEGHQEFKYETAKKNELTFDDIVPTFNKLGIKTASLTDEIKGIENIPQAEFEEVEEFEEIPEEKGIVESEQFKNVYEKVKAGVSKAKLKLLPNKTVGVSIDGEDVPFASQRYLNVEGLPSGDVEVNLRVVENIEGKYGRGVLVETQEGVPLGYIRRAGKVETGRIKAEEISPTEDVDIDVPVELSDIAKERLQQIEKDQENYELVEDELGRRYVNKKTGESYTSVSTFVSGKSGGDFKGDKRLKETAFKVGNIINGIVRDFFNGTIKSYSNYAENISRDDYDDIIRQLQDVIQYAKDKGYSIVTKPLIIADDVNKIAGQPNLLMVDENGKLYVYDVATLRNKQGLETKELLNRRYKDRPTNAERISAQVNILADILNNKYGLEVGRVGVVPFDVDYEVAKTGEPVQITQAVRTKRVDFKRKQILKPTGKTSATEVKEKVEEVKPTKEPTTTPTDIEAKKAEIIQTNNPTIQTVGNVTFGIANKQGTTEDNEDAVYVDTQNGIFILADGMGGEVSPITTAKDTSKNVINILLGNTTQTIFDQIVGIADKYEIKDVAKFVEDIRKLTGYSFKNTTSINNLFFAIKRKESLNNVKNQRTGATSLKALKKGKNTYIIEKVGDTVFFIVDKNGKVIQSHGLSDVATTQGYMFSIKDGKPFVSSPKTDNFTITLNEGETLVLATDFIETNKAIQDFIDSDFGKNLNFAKFQKNNKQDDSTFITIKYDAELAALEGKPAEKEVVKEKVKTEEKPKKDEQKEIEGKGVGKPVEEVQRGDVKEIKIRRRKRGVPKAKRKVRNPRIKEILEKVPNNPFEAVLLEFIRGVKLNTFAFQSLFGNKNDVLRGKKISKAALAEAKIRIEFWNNKIGLTIKDFAHKLWQDGDTEFYTDGDYLQAIHDVLMEYPTLSSMIEYFNNLDQVDKEAAERAEMNAFLAGQVRDGLYAEELEDYWNSLTTEEKEAIANDNVIPDSFNDYIEEELTSEEKEEEEVKPKEEGKDIIREEGEDYPFQKAKSVKSIFDEAVKLFYKIRGTEGAAKKRNLTQERKELLKENPTVRFIDNNISSIFEQLENKNIIKRKGNCP